MKTNSEQFAENNNGQGRRMDRQILISKNSRFKCKDNDTRNIIDNLEDMYVSKTLPTMWNSLYESICTECFFFILRTTYRVISYTQFDDHTFRKM